MIRMELPNDIRCVTDTAAFVSDLSTKYGVAQEKAGLVRFMIEAALEMRVKDLADQDTAVTMELEERASEFVVRIMDKGLPYVPTKYQREVFRNSGLGRLLFEQLGVDGQRLTLLIKQDPGYVMADPPAPSEETLEDTEVTCRRTRPDPQDIIEAIRCLYEVYRYEYVHQELYHTEQFEKMLRSGRYVSLLAENAHHQVLGHAALNEGEWFPGLREMCNLVVKPMARGLHLSNRLTDELTAIAVQEKAGNLYALPVLHHPVSQKLMTAAGLVPCGLYANFFDMSAIQGHEDDEGRASGGICVRWVEQAKNHVLYLPDECAGFVQGVFDAAGAPFERGSGGDAERQASSISHCVDAVCRNLEVKIDAIGPDLYDRLETWQLQNEVADLEVAMVYLNAREPGAPECYRYFRERGFVFTGCLPGGARGDYLLLQHLNGRAFNRAATVLLPNYEEMLDRLCEINSI